MLRRLLASAGVVVAALLAIAGPVSAHIDPDPAQARAGSRVTVGFTVEHGCEGSPTTQLDMRLPEALESTIFARGGNSIALGLALLLASVAVALRTRRR